MGLVFALGGVAVVVSVIYRMLANVNNVTKTVEKPQRIQPNIKQHIIDSSIKFWETFPNGIDDKDIVERGVIAGRFMDQDIYETIKLSNGWTLEWINVVRLGKNGEIKIPPGVKDAFVITMFDNKLFYNLKFDEQNNPA